MAASSALAPPVVSSAISSRIIRVVVAIDLRDGLTATYQWFRDQVAHEGELRGVEPQFA